MHEHREKVAKEEEEQRKLAEAPQKMEVEEQRPAQEVPATVQHLASEKTVADQPKEERVVEAAKVEPAVGSVSS